MIASCIIFYVDGVFSFHSLMDMLVACFQVVPMRRMMKKRMPSMQHWTRGWMKDAKKGGSEAQHFEQLQNEVLLDIILYILYYTFSGNCAFFQRAERKRRN